MTGDPQDELALKANPDRLWREFDRLQNAYQKLGQEQDRLIIALSEVEAERDSLTAAARESAIPIEFDDGSKWFIGSFSGGSLPPREMRLVLRASDGAETVYRYAAATLEAL